MELALSFIDQNDTSKFEHMEDLIHIDEKRFYLMKDGQCFIIVVDEAEPYRHVQHKSFLTKIMFLCAVARPRYDTNKNAWFDGKIGIWPIGKWAGWGLWPLHVPIGVGGFGFCCVLLLHFLVVSFHP